MPIEDIHAHAHAAVAIAVDGPFIVAAGRLDYQKGFDTLIRAFAAHGVARDHALVILGEGIERRALEQLARSLGVQAKVHLPGFVANPWAYFARASAFVCASRWEGFGNVIIEAMACGAPVIATDCDFGPREILQHQQTGWLVPVDDEGALGRTMDMVVGNRAEAVRIAAAGALRATEFDVHHMARQHEQLFRQLDGVRLYGEPNMCQSVGRFEGGFVMLRFVIRWSARHRRRALAGTACAGTDVPVTTTFICSFPTRRRRPTGMRRTGGKHYRGARTFDMAALS